MTTAPETTLVPANGGGITDLLRFAVEQKAPIDSLERLVALQERIMDRNAAAEFFDAMALFQAKCPPIPKSSIAEVTKEGRKIASYRYAELPTIAGVINPILAPLGLSYSWDSKIDATGLCSCTCTIRHRAGHMQTATFTCPISGTSLMSDAQKGAAALTYAKRQALVQALGLTTGESDTDGGEPKPPEDAITEEQAINLQSRLESLGAGELPALLAWAKIESVYDLPASKLAQALKAVTAKEGRKGK